MEATYFFTLCTLLCLWASTRLTGTWFTPLSHYALRWLFLVFLVEIDLVGYDKIMPLTWVVVIGSFLAFSCGSLLPMMKYNRNRGVYNLGCIQERLKSSIEKEKMLRAIILLFVVGTIVFVIYLYNVNRTYGIFNFLASGQILRLALGEGDVPFGFHYLYVMEMVGPLCFLYYLLYRKETPKWLFVVLVISIVSLFFTTGRTNIMKSIVWIVFVLLFFQLEILSLRKFAKIMGGLLGVVVGLFFISAVWTTKTFESTEIYSAKEFSGITAPLLLPYFYMSVQLPVLDKLLNDPEVQHTWGKYTFLPIVKVSKLVFPDIQAPSHIGKFYDAPYSANVATYLDLMYKDFWFIGPVLIPALLGFISSYLFMWLLNGRVTLGIFMINTILAMTIFSSTSSANYMKPSYWFQVCLLLIISRYSKIEKAEIKTDEFATAGGN